MKYKMIYSSPIGELVLTSDGEFLTGLGFRNSKYNSERNLDDYVEDTSCFGEVIKWLDIYFCGKNPSFTPKFKLENLTTFREDVMSELCSIPYGEVVTYEDIALNIAAKRDIKKMSAQAVGGAVGWNPICIIIPCHRVVGKNGSLTGYGGGIKNKIKLLELENIDMSKFYVPKKGTKL